MYSKNQFTQFVEGYNSFIDIVYPIWIRYANVENRLHAALYPNDPNYFILNPEEYKFYNVDFSSSKDTYTITMYHPTGRRFAQFDSVVIYDPCELDCRETYVSEQEEVIRRRSILEKQENQEKDASVEIHELRELNRLLIKYGYADVIRYADNQEDMLPIFKDIYR